MSGLLLLCCTLYIYSPRVTWMGERGEFMKNIIFTIALLFGCLSVPAQSANLHTQIFSETELNQMTLKAGKLIDEWDGRGEQLDQASDLLVKVLQSNPKHLEAHFERARYFIASGYINFRNYKPGALNNAAHELQLTLLQDPTWGKAYVLLGNIRYLENDLSSAIKLFKKAEAIGTDYKWLYINWGNTLIALNDWSEAEVKLNKARARKDLSQRELSGLYEGLINVYIGQRKFVKASRVYKDDLALNPNSAWKHGNYANFLLFKMGLPDEAIEEANKALQIMNYGQGRIILGAAQYAKWAQMKGNNQPLADEYFRDAQENVPNLAWVFPRVGASVDTGPVLQNLFQALMETGASIDMTDDKGDTAFTLAAAVGNIKAMKWLAGHGANINFTQQGVPSALEYAIKMQDYQTIDALIKLKADVNLKSKYSGVTPLMLAASLGYEQIARKLVKAGAN